MLVLSRRVNEVVKIGDDIEVVVVEILDARGRRISNCKVRLGFDAPRDVAIDRPEVRESKKGEAKEKDDER